MMTDQEIIEAAQLEANQYMQRMIKAWYPDSREQQSIYAKAFAEEVCKICNTEFNTSPYVTHDRLEDIIIKAFEHAIDVSEQATFDLIKATDMCRHELTAIGYDEDNYPDMHKHARYDKNNEADPEVEKALQAHGICFMPQSTE